MPVIFPWPNQHATATRLYILVGSSSPTPTPYAIITTFKTTESEKAQKHAENNKLSALTLMSSYFALKCRQKSSFSFASYQNSLTTNKIPRLSLTKLIATFPLPDFPGEWEPCKYVPKYVLPRRRHFWHATHDCVVPYVDIILHRGQFWAKSAASGSVRWCCFRSCWMVLSHMITRNWKYLMYCNCLPSTLLHSEFMLGKC